MEDSTMFRVVLVLMVAMLGCRELTAHSDSPTATLPGESEARKKARLKLPPDVRPAVALALSKINSVKLEDVACYFPDARAHNACAITLENELAYVGANVGKDGKLRDRQGKEIYINLRYGSGVAKSAEMIRAEQEQEKKFYDEKRKTHTIIQVDLDPFHIAP
jgi:hypothetical protein